MAQIHTKSTPAMRRVAALMRQRPGMVVAACCFLVFVVAAGGFGVAHALSMRLDSGGVEVVRGDGGDQREDVAARGASDVDQGAGEHGPLASEKTSVQAPSQDRIVVDVAGAVMQPAVVELPSGARVRDAIDACGGLSDDADAAQVNRAAPLADGQQVYIPRVGEEMTGGGAVAPGQGTPVGQGQAAALVNINTADESALDGLPGIGPATATAIVEDRAENGPFSAPEDLMRVSGIGDKKFERLKSLICV